MTELLKFLESLSDDDRLEAEWIDLLSQLEYVGARKILKGVPYERMDLSLLQHVAEEASHAFLLKAVVPQFANRSWKDGLFSEVGWKYFRGLDSGVATTVSEQFLCYPAVSWAIERRVMEVYPAYLKITRNEALRAALTNILEQEKRHGAQFEGWSFPPETREKVLNVERPLWKELLTGLNERALSPERG